MSNLPYKNAGKTLKVFIDFANFCAKSPDFFEYLESYESWHDSLKITFFVKVSQGKLSQGGASSNPG